MTCYNQRKPMRYTASRTRVSRCKCIGAGMHQPEAQHPLTIFKHNALLTSVSAHTPSFGEWEPDVREVLRGRGGQNNACLAVLTRI